jgi:hypothetical protein
VKASERGLDELGVACIEENEDVALPLVAVVLRVDVLKAGCSGDDQSFDRAAMA